MLGTWALAHKSYVIFLFTWLWNKYFSFQNCVFIHLINYIESLGSYSQSYGSKLNTQGFEWGQSNDSIKVRPPVVL